MEIDAVLEQGGAELIAQATSSEVSPAVRLVVLLTAMSFLPAMLLVMTPFTRFIIVFSLLRQALGLQGSPPNQVLVGLAMFLSMMVMQPTLTKVHGDALTPFMDGTVGVSEAMDKGLGPMREFMQRNTRKEELLTVLEISKVPKPENLEQLTELPLSVVTTAYLLTELKLAFIISVKVYLPFLMIDLVISSILLGMGMMVLPPVVISLPFKLMLFVLMDGWNLLTTNLVSSIQ